MTSRCHNLGFTFIEVLVATAIMSVILTGSLFCTFRFARFAHEQAEHMVADAYCHDVMWAIYNQKFDDIKSVGEYQIPISTLPTVVSTDVLGKKHTIQMLKRDDSYADPTCKVDVETESDEAKKISVTVSWQTFYTKTFDNSKTNHVLTVTRAKANRSVK